MLHRFWAGLLPILILSIFPWLSAAVKWEAGSAAAEARIDKKEAFVGIVEATRDVERNITAVKLILDHRRAFYQVNLDERGKALGRELDKKRAEVKGILEMQGLEKVLIVLHFQEVQESATQRLARE